MRLTRWMQGLMLVSAVACSSSVTAPPTGLPATLSVIAADSILSPSIGGAGDSVVAVAGPIRTCGFQPTVAAGLLERTLVITVFAGRGDVACPAFLTPGSYVITVHDVPSGTRKVEVAVRYSIGASASTRIVVSGPVTLP